MSAFPLRYVVAIGAAIAIIAAGMIFLRSVRADVHKLVRAAVQEAAARGELTAEAAANPDPADLGIELPEELVGRFFAADLLARYVYVWTPLVVIICLGLASFCGPASHDSR